MFPLFIRGNEALTINPPTDTNIHLTSHGSDWMWAVFSLLGLSALVFFGASYYRGSRERLFFYNAILSVFFMAISAFTVASDLGFTSIQAEFNHDTTSTQKIFPGLRQIFYNRQIAWFLAFPPLIINFGIYAAVPWTTLLFTVLNTEIWVVLLLIGALIRSTYKWGYFVFAVVAYLLAAWHMVYSFRKSAIEFNKGTTTVTTICSALLTLFIMLYTICWGLSEGGNVIQPDSEAVFYGVMDIVTFVLLSGYFLFSTRDANFEELGIIAPAGPAFHRSEKDHRYSQYSADTAAATVNQDAAGVTPAPAAGGVVPPGNTAEQV